MSILLFKLTHIFLQSVCASSLSCVVCVSCVGCMVCMVCVDCVCCVFCGCMVGVSCICICDFLVFVLFIFDSLIFGSLVFDFPLLDSFDLKVATVSIGCISTMGGVFSKKADVLSVFFSLEVVVSQPFSKMKESPERTIAKHSTKDGVVGETLVSLQMTGFPEWNDGK